MEKLPEFLIRARRGVGDIHVDPSCLRIPVHPPDSTPDGAGPCGRQSLGIVRPPSLPTPGAVNIEGLEDFLSALRQVGTKTVLLSPTFSLSPTFPFSFIQ